MGPRDRRSVTPYVGVWGGRCGGREALLGGGRLFNYFGRNTGRTLTLALGGPGGQERRGEAGAPCPHALWFLVTATLLSRKQPHGAWLHGPLLSPKSSPLPCRPPGRLTSKLYLPFYGCVLCLLCSRHERNAGAPETA